MAIKKDSQGQAILQADFGIREFYVPDEAQHKTLEYVYKKRYIPMKQALDRMDASRHWDDWEKQYEGWQKPRDIAADTSWQSKHVAPVTSSVILTALAEMIDQDVKPFYLPQGVEKQAKATLMQHIWDFAWETSNSDLLMYDVFMDYLMLGTAIVQEYYRQDKRIVRDLVPGKDNQFETKEREIFDYDDVCGEIVKLQDFYVDENARGFDGPYAARDCIRRFVMDIDDFYLAYSGTKFDQFDNAAKVRPGGDTRYFEYYQPPQGMDTSRQVEVLHYWSTKPMDRFVIVANDVVIRDGPNPYKHKQLPFCRAVDIRRTHRFYGKGEPELLVSIQDETNTLRRMIIDRNHLDIDKMFFVSNKIGLTDEDLIARPHGLIPTDDVNAAKSVEYGDIPRSVEMSLQNLEDDSTMATGINPRSETLPQANTATAATMLKEATLKRIEMKLWLLKKEFFMRLAMLRTENILQFYSQPRLHKIVGDALDQDYQKQVTDLQSQGLLVQDEEGSNYMKTYRQLNIKGSRVTHDAKGEMTFEPTQGYSNYDLKPEDFLPLPRGGYVVRFEAGSNIEISKSLTHQKNLDLYDRVSAIAMQFPQIYDIGKLTDWIIRKNYEENPDDFKPQGAQPDMATQQLQMSVELAQIENSQMINGKDIPPTPYASPVHTRIHTTFMQNNAQFKRLGKDDKITQVFTRHVVGEIMAQQYRDQQGAIAPPTGSIGGQPQPGGPTPQQAANGQQMQGPAQQSPQPTVQPSLSNGKMNRPGGMGTSNKGKLADILPNLNNGGGSPNL